MSVWEIAVLGIGLSMDAFAVAVCKGMSMKRFSMRNAVIIAFAFGFFQAMMPFIGWILGTSFAEYIEAFDHWIAFVLLSVIGVKMILDAVKDLKEHKEPEEFSLKPLQLLILAVATSIDALAVGLSFAFLNMQAGASESDPGIWISILIIGCITFMLSFAGVYVGCRFGVALESKAQFVGGGILILIGLKILFEHLGVFGG